MKLETFFDKFELFADAPNSVQKMRELVLDLAVKGKLTDRDIAKEAVDSKYSKEPTSDVLPPNWRLLNFGKFCDIQGGNQPPKSQFSDTLKPGYVRMFQIRDLGERPVPTYISKESTNRFCRDGEILIGRYGASVGKIFWAQDGAYNVALAKFLYPIDALLPDFAFWVLKSDFFQSEIAGASRSAQAGFNKGDLASIDFPLPPLAEQKRIVAKVDELMALCDRLEVQQNERQARHTALARAAVSRFADAPTPANLDFIFHHAYAITPADLRKTILTLAVQGKLVPQDPSDELALITLRQCGVDLKRWAVTENERRQDIPHSWVWIKFSGVGEQRLGKMLDAQKNRGLSKPYLRNTNVQWMRFELDDVKEMRVEEREEGELRLRDGDLLICEGGEPGRCAIWRGEVREMYFQKALHRVRPCAGIFSEYLALNLQVDCRNEVLAAYFTGATIKHLTGRSLSAYPIPIPPLAEQRRIVAKVDELMKLVDHLEKQLEDCRAISDRLLDAVVHELLQMGVTSISSLPAIDRAAIGCYALKYMQGNPSFARTAEVKVLYLAEAHLGLPLGGQYCREAAGPFDKWIYDFERQADKEGWFKTTSERLSATRSITRYQLLPGIQHKVDQALEGLGDKQAEFDRILNAFMSLSTEDIEIVGTLFAVWNDVLLDGEHPNDDWIIREVRENWHSRKQRFSPEKLSTWLAWMRKHGLVPVGQGSRTVHQSGFELIE